MDITIKTMAGKPSGALTVSKELFGLEPRQDLLSRMVRYQLAARRQGTHCVKNRSDIKATGRKMYKQKGTNHARHSTVKAPQFRGGGRVFGPTPRDHSIGLPKKVRALALRHALSVKASTGSLMVLDDIKANDSKTSALRGVLAKLGLTNALVIGGRELDRNFQLAARNIPHVDVLPVQGINVYDILRRKTLVLSKSAVEVLEERLK